MNLRRIIYIALLALLQLSCQQLPRIVDGGRVVASVGDKSLTMTEIISATPQDLAGDDSVAFVTLYAEKWIQRQIKIYEAERVFTSSVQEIESMVDAYRQALLTRKLDQFYIDSSKDEPFTDESLRSYYNANKKNYKLNNAIVKGSILRIPLSHKSTSKLTSLMKSSSKDSRQDLVSLSEKFEDLQLEEFGSAWVNYTDFIAMLPIVRGSSSDQYMTRRGVQSLKDDTHTYLFEITEYRHEGDVAPFERAEEAIRRLLTSEHQAEVIRSHEERLYKEAEAGNLVHNYINIEQGEVSDQGYFSTLFDNMKIQK